MKKALNSAIIDMNKVKNIANDLCEQRMWLKISYLLFYFNKLCT